MNAIKKRSSDAFEIGPFGRDGEGGQPWRRRHAKRQGEQGEQSAAAAGSQGQGRGQTTDQRECRRADQQGGAERGQAFGLEAEGHAQERRGYHK